MYPAAAAITKYKWSACRGGHRRLSCVALSAEGDESPDERTCRSNTLTDSLHHIQYWPGCDVFTEIVTRLFTVTAKNAVDAVILMIIAQRCVNFSLDTLSVFYWRAATKFSINNEIRTKDPVLSEYLQWTFIISVNENTTTTLIELSSSYQLLFSINSR